MNKQSNRTEACICHCVLYKDLLSSVFGHCDSCILNFESYVFAFGFYCFGLAHYRGRVWIILSIYN